MNTLPTGRSRSIWRICLAGWLAASTVQGADAPVRLEWGRIDTSSAAQKSSMRKLKSSPRPPAVQRQSSRGTVPWLVQFRGEVREEWKRALIQTGAELKGYYPENAFLVEATPSAIARIAALPEVTWVGEYRPDYKRAKAVRKMMAESPDDTRECKVFLFHPEDVERIGNEIAGLPGASLIGKGTAADRGVIRVRLSSSAVEALTGWGEVEWVEPHLEPQLWNNVAVQSGKMNVSNVWTELGLTGAGQTIAVCDTGLDTGNLGTLHRDFTNRVTPFAWSGGAYAPGGNWSDTHGHGTHVAGSLVGNGAMSTGFCRGVAYEADLIVQGTGAYLGGIPDDLNILLAQAFTNGARIHSDSWGYNDYGGYSWASRCLDMFVWSNKTMLVLVSAGNSGIDSDGNGVVDLSSVGSPGTSKNCLTLGAAESFRTTGGYSARVWSSGSWASKFTAEPVKSDLISSPDSPQGIAAFSSRGPCSDGRVKPDLVAPGTDILSSRSRVAPNAGWGAFAANTNYMFYGGTSMATPLTAGAAALTRQWLAAVRGMPDPSAALVKALLINGARNMAPGQYGTGGAQEIPFSRPNMVAGWGHVDLYPTLQPAANRYLDLHDTNSLATGETNVFTMAIDLPVTNKVILTLAYSDYWASLAADRQLVNDLDLTVRKPGGQILYANGLTNVDALNNVEMIEFAPDEAGDYEIRVAGRSVPEGGRQDYALVVRGVLTHVAPVFDELGAQGANVGAPTNFTVRAQGEPTPALALAESTATGGFSFDPQTGVLSYVPPAGDLGLRWFVFTASNSSGVATQTVAVTVAKALPVIAAPPAAATITFGQTLGEAALSGGEASVPGSFAFAAPGTVPNAGTALQAVIFTPTDTAGYESVSLNVSVTVLKAGQTIAFPEIGDQLTTNVVALAATASSGLPVGFAVASGPAAINGATLTFTGTGAVSIAASQAGDANWNSAPTVSRSFQVDRPPSSVELHKTTLNVREGGEGRLFIRLSVAPTATVVTTMIRVEGNTNLWIKSGGVQTFTPANWNVWRIMTLAANEDDNADAEQATFRISMPGRADLFATATALDDELGANIALATGGATIAGTGAVSATNLIDGIHTVAANYGYTVWNGTPPGTMILDLKVTSTVTRVRILNADWSYRLNRYRIESSLDGAGWTMLADASASERSGWDDWAGAGLPVRYLRFTGLSNTFNQAVCIAEWEVLGSPFVKAPATVALGGLQQTYDGTPRAATATTDPAGLAVAITYDGSAQAPTAIGTYAVVATVQDLLYQGAATGVLVVAKAPATVTLDGLQQTYDGTPRVATATTDPAGLAVAMTYDGNPAAPVAAGTYVVVATVNDATYAGSATGALVVAKADQTIAFPEFLEVFTDDVLSLSATAGSGLPVTYAVANGPATINGTTLSFTGTGAVSMVASQAGDGNWNAAPDVVRSFTVELPRPVPRFGKAGVNVREGADGRVYLRLSSAPTSTVVVRMTYLSGDTNLWIKSGGVQTITPANWNVWRIVTLAANEDANEINETTIFKVAMPGAADRTLTATALDDDFGANLALASAGAVISGTMASSVALAIDGVHTSSANYAYTTWTNDPPGTMTLDLKAMAAVARVRVLNYDWSYRVHRYRIESSQDGAAWTTLADASAGEHSGWEDWPAGAAPLRYLRFTGLSNSANPAVCIAEWEVYGQRVPWQQDQTINFPAIGDKLTTDVVGLAATASSGLPVAFAVAAGPATISGGTNLSFTGTGVVSVVASQAGDENDWYPAPDVVRTFAVARPTPALEFSKTQINVRESGEGRFFMRLSAAPEATVVSRMYFAEGDTNVWIKSGGVQTFTPANWSVWRTVTLAANDDANDVDETASFRMTLPGAADRMLAATALDDDLGANLALASAGAVISGTLASYLPMAIDGVHTSSANYAYATWTNSPPGTMTLDLMSTTGVSRVRLLNWDFSYRVHRYTVESSVDGAVWTLLADASEGEHCGWEDWPAGGSAMRYLRFTALSNSANSVVCVAEWEVYGSPGPAAARSLAPGADSPAPAATAESEPVMVLTAAGPEDESGWAAVDGDPETAWVGRKAGGYIVAEYAPALILSGLEVDTAEGSPADIQVFYSRDGEEWLPLPDDLEALPVALNFLWLLFPEDGSGSAPQVLEIRPRE